VLLSAIVLNYRSPKDTVNCVQALLAQTLATGDSCTSDWLEVIVVDNHSQDDSIGSIRNRLKDPRVRIVETRDNIGYGKGNALGIQHARGEFLIIINPDNELPPDGAATLINALKADPTIGIIAPKLVFPDGSVRDSFRSFPSMLDVIAKRSALGGMLQDRLRRYLKSDADSSAIQDTDWVVGACMLLRKKFYEELGGFDHRFFLFFEDIDLCRRCWQSGKRVVYYPLVTVLDRKARLSEGGVWSLITRKVGRAHLASAMKYFWKWNIARAEKGSCGR
jgi:GT2 family glycosyltransferase